MVKPLNETKGRQLQIRISQIQKDTIDRYCKENNIKNKSDWILKLIDNEIQKNYVNNPDIGLFKYENIGKEKG